MDIELAATAAATLVAQGFFSEVGASTWSGFQKMMEVVRGRFRGAQLAETVLLQVERSPNDQVLVNELARHLELAMSNDISFAQEIAQLVESAAKSPATKSIVARVYNDYSNAQIEKVVNIETVNGDVNF